MTSKNAKKLLKYFAFTGGVILVSFIAPQLPYNLLKSFLKEKDRVDRRKIRRNIKNLESLGYIKFRDDGDQIKVSITKKGAKKALEFNLKEIELQKPKKWDGKWRLVIFDIPESKKDARNALRDLLKKLEFATIQKSVYVTPYPCEKEIYYIKELFGVFKYVNLVEANKLDEHNEKLFKDRFNLK